MNDEGQERKNELFKQNLRKLEEDQAELNRLRDKSIGGTNAPVLRPSDDMIPKDMTRQEMIDKADERAERQYAQEQQDRINAARHKQGMIDHQKKTVERGMVRPPQDEKPKRKLSEQGQKPQQEKKREGQGPRKLSEQSRDRKIEFKRGGRGQ